MFTYSIDGQTYIQKELVWGQWLQVLKEIEGIVLPEDLQPLELVRVLKEKLPRLIAIVIAKEGEGLKDRNIDVLADQLSFAMTPQQMIDVVSDFFDVNPLHSLLKNLIEKVDQIRGKVEEGMSNLEKIPNEQSSTSLEGTS